MEGERNEGIVMRKGPWLAEEDQILMDYVKKHGPRDWSSIRLKGLLPRTGKSCRLRWVNKLKPNLKSGCKFTPEEERIVIDLQAQFGNKWARIATYLPGRTDNDVKNFWSTRQKRVARISRSSHPPEPQNIQEKMISHTEISSLQQACRTKTNPFQGEKTVVQSSGSVNSTDVFNVLYLPEIEGQSSLKVENETALVPFSSEEKMNCLGMTSQISFPQFPPPSLGCPVFSAVPDFPAIGMDDFSISNFAMDEGAMFRGFCHEEEDFQFPSYLQELGPNEKHPSEMTRDVKHFNTPDSFFDDFPADMFDLEPLPSPSHL